MYRPNKPCVSAIALITFLNQNGNYPLPASNENQKNILNSVANNHILRSWDIVLDEELEYFALKCKKADIDFEFVINVPNNGLSSTDWNQLMKNFGKSWIEDILIPRRNHFI